MDINKKILTDEQIKNLPLFFKVIYYNEMVSIEAENRLMKYNNNIHAVEMRHYNPNRKICLPYELTQFVKKMKYNKNLYFIVSSSCQMTKGYSKTLLQDFSRKSLEYIPNDYYMITKLLDRHQIGEIAEKISDSSMGNFEKYINFMIDKEYAFLTKDISLFPPKCHVVHDSLFPINDAIVEFNPIVSNMEEMYSYLKELNSMQCPYLQIRFSPSSNYPYIVDVVNRICTMDFECVDIHIADSHKTPMQAWNKLILKNAAVSRVYLYNQPQSKVFPFNVKPSGNENLLMGEIIAIKHPLDAKHCGKISKYTMQFFNEELYEVSKCYNSCLYKKIAINESGSVKNCLALDKEYDVSNGLAEIVYSKEFRQCWSIKKDNIKVCKDCELRYNCIDCRAGHQVDNGSKPVGCNYDPYKLIWNDEHK